MELRCGRGQRDPRQEGRRRGSRLAPHLGHAHLDEGKDQTLPSGCSESLKRQAGIPQTLRSMGDAWYDRGRQGEDVHRLGI